MVITSFHMLCQGLVAGKWRKKSRNKESSTDNFELPFYNEGAKEGGWREDRAPGEWDPERLDEDKKNHTKQVAIVSGAIVTGIMGGASAHEANAGDLFNYTTLGTGSELRNELIDMNMVDKAVGPETIRARVWEGSCGEGKCGEGKCGDKSKDKDNFHSSDVHHVGGYFHSPLQ